MTLSMGNCYLFRLHICEITYNLEDKKQTIGAYAKQRVITSFNNTRVDAYDYEVDGTKKLTPLRLMDALSVPRVYCIGPTVTLVVDAHIFFFRINSPDILSKQVRNQRVAYL